MKISEETLERYISMLTDMLVQNAPNFILAIVTLFVGYKLINMAVKIVDKALEKSSSDPTLRPFIETLITWALRILLFVSVASMLGIETTSFVAMIGAAGLAVGLALQGTLANFAGGVLILVFKPFKVGDFIEAQGYLGTVKEIKIFTTYLTTPQNRLVIIPNGTLSNGSLTNFTGLEQVRVDISVGISYNSSIKDAKNILMEILKADERVLEDPEPLVAVAELADSSVNFHVRPWVNTADHWPVYFDVLEKIKLEFDKNGIIIPYPQRDVHIHNNG